MIGKIFGVVGVIGVTAAAGMVFSPTTHSAHNASVHVEYQIVANDSLIYPSLEDASILTNISEDSIKKSLLTGTPVEGFSFDYYK